MSEGFRRVLFFKIGIKLKMKIKNAYFFLFPINLAKRGLINMFGWVEVYLVLRCSITLLI